MTIPVYDSFENKKRFFPDNDKDWKIDNKNDFDSFYKKFTCSSASKCIFRGMGEAKYKLFTSFQRYYIESRIPSAMGVQNFIQKEINNVNSDPLCEYYKRLNVKTSDYLYLSFLQHYGAPTPLLDFSHDINVALYFATENLKYGQGGNDIDDYFSLYYICIDDKFRNIVPNLSILLKDKYLSSIDSWLKMESADDNVERIFSRLSSIKDFLSLSKMEECLIEQVKIAYISNKRINSRKEGIPEDVDIWKLSEKVRAYCNAYRKRTNYEDKINEIVGIVQTYFEKYAQITNLNLVAQKGCFLTHNFQIANPMEEILNTSQGIIHCVNIHKSLGEYLMEKCNKTKEDIYPNPRQIAKDSYVDILRTLQ